MGVAGKSICLIIFKIQYKWSTGTREGNSAKVSSMEVLEVALQPLLVESWNRKQEFRHVQA